MLIRINKYEKWHNLLGAAGNFWDGFVLINGVLNVAEGDYVNAAISFACGIPAVGNIVAGVARASKAVKAIKAAEKIASACRTVGKIGNTAAVKACYDIYQTAQRECDTTIEKIAYVTGTLAAGYLMGKAAKWGADKIKNLASKALPKLKTAVQESAGKLVSRINKGFGSSGSGYMNRNRGFAINPFYMSSGKLTDSTYDGVKRASEYLKQQGVPRQYRKQILESFDVRTIKLEIAGENTYGLRFYGGNANAKGRYLFETFSSLTNRANLALPYEWNSMTGIQQFQVKRGTVMITGSVAPQSSFGEQYIGGAHQWYINNLEDLIKCQ